MAAQVKVADFVVDDSAAKEIQNSVDKAAGKDQEEEKKEEGKEQEQEQAQIDSSSQPDDIEKLKEQFT